MPHLSRRDALSLAVGAAASPLLPAIAVAAPPTLFPVWTVGTPGEMNWRVIAAATEDAARKLWLEWESLDDADEDDIPELDVRPTNPAVVEPQEYESEISLTCEQYESLGWDQVCERCQCESDPSNYRVLPAMEGKSSFVVCHDCMRTEDWKHVDPDMYEEELAAERESQTAQAPKQEVDEVPK